jgi:hypothetical protein
MVAASTEVVICGFLSMLKSIEQRLILILWFSSIMAAYRILKLAYGFKEPCMCFGSITQWLPLLDKHLEKVSIITLSVLFIPSAAMIVVLLIKNTSIFRGDY